MNKAALILGIHVHFFCVYMPNQSCVRLKFYKNCNFLKANLHNEYVKVAIELTYLIKKFANV